MITWNNGSLTGICPNNSKMLVATEGKSSGKWYWEVTWNSGAYALIGISDGKTVGCSTSINSMYLYHDGFVYGKDMPRTNYSDACNYGDTIGILINKDEGFIQFYINGTPYEKIYRDFIKTDTIYPSVTSGSSGTTNVNVTANFGSSIFTNDKYTEILLGGYMRYDVDYYYYKFLIKYQNSYYTINELQLVNLGDIISESLFIENGFEYSILKSVNIWDEFTEPIELICFSNNNINGGFIVESETPVSNIPKNINVESLNQSALPNPTDIYSINPVNYMGVLNNSNNQNINIESLSQSALPNPTGSYSTVLSSNNATPINTTVTRPVNILSYLSEISTISSDITIEGFVNTITRYLLSTDNGITWKAYNINSGIWDGVEYSEIINKGMSRDLINSLDSSNYKSLINNSIYLNNLVIGIGYYNKNNNLKSIVKTINVEYVENKPPIIQEPSLSPDSVHNEYATLSAILKDFEGDRIKYRVLVQKANDSLIVVPTLSSNIDNDCVVTSSGIYDESFDSYNIFNPSGEWRSQDDTLDKWIEVELPNNKYILEYNITCSDDPNTPKSWILEGSMDGINWSLIDRRTNEPRWDIDESRIYSAYSNYYGKHIRLRMLDKHDGDNYVSIKSLSFKGGDYYIADDWVEVNNGDGISKSYNYPYFDVGKNTILLETRDQRNKSSYVEKNLTITNSVPMITYTYTPFDFKATLSDPESDLVSMQISINDEVVLPFTEFMNTPKSFEYEWDNSKMIYNAYNRVKIELKDNFTGYYSEEFIVIGEHKTILFMDEDGKLYSDNKGNTNMSLDMGKTIIGNDGDVKKVYIKNNTNCTLSEMSLTSIPDKSVPDNVQVLYSKTKNPFIPSEILKITEDILQGDTHEIYLKLHTTDGRGVIDGSHKLHASGKIKL